MQAETTVKNLKRARKRKYRVPSHFKEAVLITQRSNTFTTMPRANNTRLILHKSGEENDDDQEEEEDEDNND